MEAHLSKTVQLAHEAGFIKTVDCCGVPDKFCGQDEWKGNLKAFEALVRADEREACARVCEDMAKGYEERAEQPEKYRDINPDVARVAVMTCGFVEVAIRARGNK